MPLSKVRVPIQNRILTALPRRTYKVLLSKLQPITLKFNQVLFNSDEPVHYVYFPNDGMISLVASREDGKRSVEVGVVGCDGMVGVSALLGNPLATTKAVTQLPGSAMRLRVDVLRSAAESPGPLRKMLERNSHALLIQLTRSIVCNRFHKRDERLARWLLMTHDYANADSFSMTHEFMSTLLGSRRADVTQAAAALQKAGSISYHRGNITILDRERLRAACCNCYQIVRSAIDAPGV